MATFDDFFGTSFVGMNPFLTNGAPQSGAGDPNAARTDPNTPINPTLPGLSPQASAQVTSGGQHPDTPFDPHGGPIVVPHWSNGFLVGGQITDTGGPQSPYANPQQPPLIPTGGKSTGLTQQQYAEQQRNRGLAPEVPEGMVRYGNTLYNPAEAGPPPKDPYPVQGTVAQQQQWLINHAFDTTPDVQGTGARTTPPGQDNNVDPNLPPGGSNSGGGAIPRPPTGPGSLAGVNGATTSNNSSSTGMAVGDLGPIRNNLQNFFLQHFLDPMQKYTGNLQTAQSPLIQQGADASQQSMQLFQNVYNDASRTSDRMQPYFDQSWDAAQKAGSATSDFNQEMMRTGGAPDITAALENIRTKGMSDLADQLAQIREQYGQWGLGRSSDINEGLARGAAKGVADINAQQSVLTADTLNQAANRRIQASGLESTAQGQSASLFNSLMGTMNQSIMGQENAQLGAGQGMAGAGQNLITAGNADTQRMLQNTMLPYQEFMRTSQQYPFMDKALAFATGFPPSPNQAQGFNWGNLIGSAISIAAMAA